MSGLFVSSLHLYLPFTLTKSKQKIDRLVTSCLNNLLRLTEVHVNDVGRFVSLFFYTLDFRSNIDHLDLI